MRNLNTKKILYLSISLMIILCVGLVCNIRIAAGNQDHVVKKISAQEFSALSFWNTQISIDKNGDYVYVPENEDPQVYLSVTNEKINSVQVNFASGLEQDTVVMLFYCKDGEGFAIENIEAVTVPKGSKRAILFIPEEKYAILRLDINGTYLIESVDLGITENSGSILSSYYDFNIAAFLLLVLLLVLLAVLEKKIRYYNFVKTILWVVAERIRKFKLISNIRKKYFRTQMLDGDEAEARKTANCFAALAFVFGLLFIYLVPPCSGPDESTHFAYICQFLSGHMFAATDEGKVGGYLRPEEIRFIEQTVNEYCFDFYKNNTYCCFDNNYDVFAYQSSSVEFLPSQDVGVIPANPMSYFLALFGIVIVKLLIGISNPYNLLICARLSHLLFSIILIRLAILKTPVLRNTMFLLSLMPMTIYQFSSVSYDTEVICGSFMLFAYAMRLIMAEESYRITKNDIVAICISCACLFAAKIAYIHFMLVLLAISRKKFGNIKRYSFSIFLVVMIGVVFYLIPNLLNNYSIGQTSRFEGVEEQKNFILSNLYLVPTILIRTFQSYKSYWLHAFVGTFGTEKIYFPTPFAICYVVILAFFAFYEVSSIKKLHVFARASSLFGVFVAVMGTMLAMYVGWNPLVTKLKGAVAFGVQARYFIPLALFSFVWMANPLLCKFKYAKNVNAFLKPVSKFVVTAYLLLSCVTLFSAYWL